MKIARFVMTVTLALGGLTGCGSDVADGLGIVMESPALPMTAPVMNDEADATDFAPFPQFRSYANNWEDEDYSLTPELEAAITVHMAEPIEYEIGVEFTEYRLPYDAHFAREIEARDRFAAIHAAGCGEIESGSAYELSGRGCRQLVNRIFDRSGRLRGTLAFAQRNYLIRMTDAELEALRDELAVIADGIGAIYEGMRLDSSRGLLSRQQREDMQQTPGVLAEIAFVWELRVLNEYLALDDERRSLYRAAVRATCLEPVSECGI